MSFCVLLFVVSLSTLVLGDANHKYEVESLEVENQDNDCFGKWTASFKNGKGSAKFNFGFPIKKDTNKENVMVNFLIEMPGQDPVEKSVTFADALEDKANGESFDQKLNPAGRFTKGDYSVKDWSPSMQQVPSGTEGPVRITASIGSEDGKTYAKIICALNLSY